MNLQEKLLARIGKTELPQWRKKGVQYTNEFRRIEQIPRRTWETSLDLTTTARCIYEELRLSSSEVVLWPVQIAAIAEAVLYGGGFFPIGVGKGKAFISILVASAFECERPVVVVPAQLRNQTKEIVIPRLKKDWRIHENLVVIGYEELGLEKNADLLAKLNPDVCIFDECQYLKNLKAGRTKRINRYQKGICVAMSGTITKHSLQDFSHIIHWCLKENTPLPLNWNELMDWCDVLDTNIPEENRIEPGALERFCTVGENVRQGFHRRLCETPGVVSTKLNELEASVLVREYFIKSSDQLKNYINECRNLWETIDGDIISEAAILNQYLKQFALGFYYKWVPSPPIEWMDARCVWKAYVRATLRNNRRGLDTELQVWNECKNKNKDFEKWVNWKNIKDSFKPNSVPVWIDDCALSQCCRWLEKNIGICWVSHIAFGEELSRISGYKYYGAGNESINCCDGKTSIIASIGAHGQGKNLQMFYKNLITCPPSSGDTWEQLMGRTYRSGQKADTVYFDVFLHTAEYKNSFEKALSEAKKLSDLTNKQILELADIVRRVK